ncbi:hypothetical protein [Peribacillus sp. NPDC058075]|uniref:hypothetical protein n=1 Tax=unclassified Peribacillus TaxID=2675266 RepID=UPI0036DCEEA6
MGYVVDPAGNKRGSKSVKVIDKTARSVPTVNKITNKTVTVTVTVTGKSKNGASLYLQWK